VKILDTSVILVIIFGAFFIIGGPIIGHYASKASEKEEQRQKEIENSKKK